MALLLNQSRCSRPRAAKVRARRGPFLRAEVVINCHTCWLAKMAERIESSPSALSDDVLLLILESGGLVVAGICARTCKDWRRVVNKARCAWAVICEPSAAKTVREEDRVGDELGKHTIDLSSLPEGGVAQFRSNGRQHCITFYTPDLTECHSITKYCGAEPGEWKQPSALVTDGRRHLYTAECDDTCGTHRIQQFRILQIDLSPLPRAPPMAGSDGGPQLQFVSSAPLPRAGGGHLFFYRGGGHHGGSLAGQLMRPVSLALSDSGRRIFVADSGNHRIAVFDTEPTLEFAVNLGGPHAGSGEGEFHTPVCLVRHGSELYVCDRDNDRIVVIHCKLLEPVRTFGSSGGGPGQFTRPSRACVCAERLLVLDAPLCNSRVQLLTLGGVPQQVVHLAAPLVAMCSAAPGSGLLLAPQASSTCMVLLPLRPDGAALSDGVAASSTSVAYAPDAPVGSRRAPPDSVASPHRTRQVGLLRRARRLYLARLLLGLPPWLIGALGATGALMVALILGRE